MVGAGVGEGSRFPVLLRVLMLVLFFCFVRSLVAVSVVCVVAVVALVYVLCLLPSGKTGYVVLKCSGKSGDLYCVDVGPGGSRFLMDIIVEKPVEIVLANPVQLFANVRIIVCNVMSHRCATYINVAVLEHGHYIVNVSSQIPGTYCFKIVNVG